jgi:hypothetical protein
VQAASVDSPSAVGSAIVTVTAPPVLNSVSPNAGVQGTNVSLTLNGSNFLSGATVAVDGTGVSASNVKVVSSTQITATLNIAATAPAGAHHVTVTTAIGTSGAQTFTVTPPTVKPTLSTLSPNSGNRGTSVRVTLTGTNFAAPATISVASGGITVSNVAIVSATKITATFRVSSTAARQAHTVTVTTHAGASNSLSFTVQ